MASRPLALTGAVLAAAALALAGCGGGDGAASSTATPAPAPPETTPTQATLPTKTGTATTPAPPTTQTEAAPSTSPESQPGGAGDEQPMRVPAAFTLGAGGVTPPEVEVPAFFSIELVGISRDGHPHTLGFRGVEVRVPAGGRGSATFEGLRSGRYPVTVDGRAGAAKIVSGAQAGP